MRIRVVLAALVVAFGIVAAGCGAVAHMSVSDGNTATGKQLFLHGSTPACGSCHTLADAGSTGIVGPNLDAAFGPVRNCQGFKDVESTIVNLVRGQIAYADENPETGTPAAPTPGMPANLFTGQKAKDVAAYVASVAGVHWSCKAGTEAGA
jgi:mono/diheme cytochrome c family protein